MSEELRMLAARSMLSLLPFMMRTVGAGMRHGGGEVAPHQHRLLGMIAARPRTLSQIAETQGVTPATATALVTTLENRGWVRRSHDAEDRRRVLVTLTEEGMSHLKASQATAEQAVSAALESLTDEQVRRLIDGLEVLDDLRGSCPPHAPHPCGPEGGPESQ